MTNNRRLVFPALLTAGVLWGTTVPLSKVALGWLPPGWLAFVRFALAAAILLVASWSRLRAAFSPAITITGAIGYGGSVLLQNFGIDRTSVTHAALLIGVTPVLVAITAAVLRHSVARPLAWAGFAMSLAGVGFIAGGQGSRSSLAGDGLVLAAQLISAGFTVSQARLLRGRDPIAVTGLQLLGAAIVVLPVALITEHQAAGPGSPTAVLATIGLVLAGTVLPTSLFAFGQSRVSADVAGAFLNLEPLVGAIMGMALFAEPAGPTQLAGGTAISVGIGLSAFQVIRGQRRHASTPGRVGAPSEVSMPSGVSAPSEVSMPSGVSAPSGVTASRRVTVPSGVTASRRVTVPSGVTAPGQVIVPSRVSAPRNLSAPGRVSEPGDVSAGSHAGTGSLASASIESAVAAEAADSSLAASPAAPGEAPSVVKRTKFPRSRPAGTARLRRPRFRPSGHPESAAHPAHRTSRSRRERDRRGPTGLP